MATDAAPPSPWAYVRAALIAVVLLAQWVDAMPLPELREKDLKNPIAADEVKRWTEVVNSFGYETTEEELVAGGLAVGEVMRNTRKTLMDPWKPFRRITGTGQGWGLFAYPDPYSGRLIVDARTADGEFETWFNVPEVNEGLLGRRLSYRRMRGIWDDVGDRPRPGKLYKAFARWIAKELFEEHPELVEVEVRIDRHKIVLPKDGEPPEDKRRHAVLVTRTETAPGKAAGEGP